MVGGALYRHNQTPVLRVGDLQTRKQLYRRGSPSGASIPNPRSGSQPGGPALGGGAPQSIWRRRPVEPVCGAPQDRDQPLLLEGAQAFLCAGPRAWQLLPRRLGQTYLPS